MRHVHAELTRLGSDAQLLRDVGMAVVAVTTRSK